MTPAAKASKAYTDFVKKQIIDFIVRNPNAGVLEAKMYGIDLKEFKEEHSEEITFALLKK